MIRYLFLAFCIMFSPCLLAQKYEISLAKRKTSKPLQKIAVSKIIDLRYDKTNIGWIQKGLSSDKVPADFKTAIDQEIITFLKNNIAVSDNSIPLIVKINKLEIAERWNGNFQYAAAEVALEFLVRRTDGSGYCSVLNSGSYREPYLTSDVTGIHDENIATVLEDCFSQISKLNIAEICSQVPALPEDYLQVNTYFKEGSRKVPALEAAFPKKGVYQNFQEFQNNAPSLDQEVSMDKNGKFFYNASGKKVEKVWGYSDGKNAYILHADDKNYYPLTKLDDQFIYSGSVTTYSDGAILAGKILSVAAGGTVGGGGLLASELSKKKSTAQFTINMITGRLKQVSTTQQVTVPNQKGKIVLFRNAKNEAKAPISIFANDSLIAIFPPNSFSTFEFDIPVQAAPFNFCLKSTEQYCQQIAPNADNILYFECSLPEKSGAKPSFKISTSKEATYYEKIIKYNQEKAKKQNNS